MCGEPVIIDALTGAVLHVIRDVGGGDEVWYNPGDGRFYLTSSDNTVVVVPPATAAPTVLGVIDAEDSSWLQNVPDSGGRNPSAFPENNRIFSPVRAAVGPLRQPTRFAGLFQAAVVSPSSPIRAGRTNSRLREEARGLGGVDAAQAFARCSAVCFYYLFREAVQKPPPEDDSL